LNHNAVFIVQELFSWQFDQQAELKPADSLGELTVAGMTDWIGMGHNLCFILCLIVQFVV
jgi:hypothetical protein